MPEHNTRQASIENLNEVVLRLTQSQHFLAQNHMNLTQAQPTMDNKNDSVLQHPATLTVTLTPQCSSPPVLPLTPPPSHPYMKLDVPHFDGQDPLGWIFKITQFVDYQAVLGNKCLTVASFYMEGLTLCWYQWMS